MIQKCSLMNVAEVFFKEPTKVHFIKEISRKIKLAPTSVRVHIKTLKKEGIIIKKEASPFNGLVANLDSSKFIFYKRASNLFSLFNLREAIINSIAPSAIILFGSYSMGEDTEDSDIDFIVLAKERLKIIIPATPKETMYKFLEEYYETAVQLITALMYSEGLKTLNHIGLIQYLKKYNEFSKQEIFILDQMRKFRHGTIYYGRKESGDFFINNEEAIKRIINKLLKISERLK